MPEATMLVLDNSEYMRNGDFIPTRWGAQTDATTIIFDAKTQSNPENMVGVMTMAGKSPRVLSTFSTDIGKLLQSMHASQICGDSDVSTGINIAQLALKHRQNKVHTQRIVVFVGSPVKNTEDDLTALGKRLKKNNVALDVVNFGEDAENEAKLQKLVDGANSGENSHLVTVAAGTALLSDVLISSPILQDGGETGAGPSAGHGGQSFEFGVDPGMDPELAMALRMSLEEEQARQRAAEGDSASADRGHASRPEATEGQKNASEDAMLKQALALSQGRSVDEDVQMNEEMTEEEAIARAIEMSLQDEENGQG
ncbi:hypothetical protein BCV69DRAFT_308075 [Microstroma glucosiphilum]|uniref:VWFA domain-containing protein n=1 Tax=Pseudomicrostroma glucosiphilum TaxID=1684307 RepID=A0A316U8F6_9BASI|nr:hypothetical protein BCV69DRAFT_308075 [Pseudomicrostroma glucosiphilum]PWN21128.1 hypothetical protein BCV69DRAFT_308075 [Pseudomicrostroma glucosiphilum]